MPSPDKNTDTDPKVNRVRLVKIFLRPSQLSMFQRHAFAALVAWNFFVEWHETARTVMARMYDEAIEKYEKENDGANFKRELKKFTKDNPEYENPRSEYTKLLVKEGKMPEIQWPGLSDIKRDGWTPAKKEGRIVDVRLHKKTKTKPGQYRRQAYDLSEVMDGVFADVAGREYQIFRKAVDNQKNRNHSAFGKAISIRRFYKSSQGFSLAARNVKYEDCPDKKKQKHIKARLKVPAALGHYIRLSESIDMKKETIGQGDVRFVRKGDDYFVVIPIKRNKLPLRKTGETYGIDMGVYRHNVTGRRSLFTMTGQIDIDTRFDVDEYRSINVEKEYHTDDDGNIIATTYWVPDWIALWESQENKKYQRLMSRCVKGSGQWRKYRNAHSAHAAMIANAKDNLMKKLTSKIIRTLPIRELIMEDLNIKAMQMSGSLGRSINSAGMGNFMSTLKYLGEEHGVSIKKVHQFYPSSKNCSSCGITSKEDGKKTRENNNLTILHSGSLVKFSCGGRVVTCTQCGISMNRDANAAINMKQSELTYAA